MSTPVRNTGAIEFPFVAWGIIFLYFLFFPLSSRRCLLPSSMCPTSWRLTMLTRAAGDGWRTTTSRGSSGVDGAGGKRVSMQRSRPRLDQRGVQIGEVWVRRLSVHRPIRGCWYQNRRASVSKATTDDRRLTTDDSWAAGSDGPQRQRPYAAVGRSPCVVARRDLIKTRAAWRNSDAASEPANSRAETNAVTGSDGSESVRDAKKTSVTPF
ncbi:hypothetical protein QBC39DRAFT_287 [Podospora conica]|nr:hypothetical protein QBC39DRAFT_287 [Schizothecium conicum]